MCKWCKSAKQSSQEHVDKCFCSEPSAGFDQGCVLRNPFSWNNLALSGKKYPCPFPLVAFLLCQGRPLHSCTVDMLGGICFKKNTFVFLLPGIFSIWISFVVDCVWKQGITGGV